MVDIQSATAENRRGKKEERKVKKKRQDKNILASLFHRAAIITTLSTSPSIGEAKSSYSNDMFTLSTLFVANLVLDFLIRAQLTSRRYSRSLTIIMSNTILTS